MTNKLLSIIIAVGLLFPNITFGQATAPDLGATSTFALFTAAGLVTNVGPTTISGNIGTDAEGYSGFASVVQPFGSRYNPGTPATMSAATDVLTAYNNLKDQTSTAPLGSLSAPAVQTLTPQVYFHGGAGTLAGDLILDAQNNPNAIFIIQFGGAFSTADESQIILRNGASYTNVYWQVGGAVELGANSVFYGTIIADGAISLKEGASLQGKALSTGGAVNLNSNTILTPFTTLPVTLTSFTAKKGENQTALLNWATTAETNSDRFEVEHSMNGKNWTRLTTVEAKGESNVLSSYEYIDVTIENGTNLYRLKMIDRDATFAYSRIRSVEFVKGIRTVLYPNPTVDKLMLDVDDFNQVNRIQLSDITGRMVYDQIRTSLSTLSANVDMKNFPSGMYIVKITRETGNVASVKILKQ